MVKIILCADSHLGFDHPVRKSSKRPRRGEDFFQNFQLILDYAVENKIDLLLHGGDFFYRSKVPAIIVTKAYEMLFNCAEQGIPVVIVPGNHERSVLPQSILTRHPNIHIFTEAEKFNFKLNGVKLSIYGFPFIRKTIAEEFPIIIRSFEQDIDINDYNILCFHQTVEGCSVGPANFIFKKGPDVISFADLPVKFNLIFSGHIHRRQILWKQAVNRKIPLVYPGSIERTSFAEKKENKGFYTLELNRTQASGFHSNLRFHTLPVRDMIDIKIPRNIDNAAEFNNFLGRETADITNNSIIRFSGLNSGNQKFFTKNYLQKILPEETILQLRGSYKK